MGLCTITVLYRVVYYRVVYYRVVYDNWVLHILNPVHIYNICVICAIALHFVIYTQLYTTVALSHALHKIAVEDCVHFYISPSHASRPLVFSYHITVTIYK